MKIFNSIKLYLLLTNDLHEIYIINALHTADFLPFLIYTFLLYCKKCRDIFDINYKLKTKLFFK